MNGKVTWTEGMHFAGESDGHRVNLDAKAPIGKGTGMSPKELVALGVAGCTAMDVIALLKKHKQPFTAFSVGVEATQTSGGHPVVFESVGLVYRAQGEIDPKVLLESVNLSQTKYCGVSAMIAKTAPINYKVELNGEQVGEGRANF